MLPRRWLLRARDGDAGSGAVDVPDPLCRGGAAGEDPARRSVAPRFISAFPAAGPITTGCSKRLVALPTSPPNKPPEGLVELYRGGEYRTSSRVPTISRSTV